MENVKKIHTICFSTVGQRHISTGRRCEDRSKAFSANGVTAIAVADGAGSDAYDFAADGAQCVVDTITKFLCNNFEKFYATESEEELATVVIGICREALQKKAEELGVDSIQRMASTLLVAAVKGYRYIVCHLGDGVIGRLTPNGAEVITAPDNGEFAGTTFFVPTQGAVSHLRIKKGYTGNTISFFMMSDGVADFLLNADGTFATAAEKMALLAEKSDGQQQLEKIMQETIVQLDAMSDDCSYAGLSVRRSTNEQRQRIRQASPKSNRESAFEEPEPEELYEDPEQEGDQPPFPEIQPPVNAASASATKRKRLWVIPVVVGLCAMTFVVVFAVRHKTKKPTPPAATSDAYISEETTIPDAKEWSKTRFGEEQSTEADADSVFSGTDHTTDEPSSEAPPAPKKERVTVSPRLQHH